MRMRCVVTGIDAKGKAVFRSDGEARDRLVMGSFEMGDAWSTAGALTVGPGVDSRSAWKVAALPPPGGTVLRYAVIPPAAVQEAELRQATSVAAAGDFHVEGDDPTMHATDTVDFGFVLAGEVGLELDEGAITWLKPGDCFVQQGTRHAWRNRGNLPAVIGVVMVGAQRRSG